MIFYISDAAIIHQSPFNVKARERLELLDRIINKIPLKDKPTNSLYSREIVLLFYKMVCLLTIVDRFVNRLQRKVCNNYFLKFKKIELYDG